MHASLLSKSRPCTPTNLTFPYPSLQVLSLVLSWLQSSQLCWQRS